MSSLQSQWPNVKKRVNDAVSLDLARDRSFDAYRRYLDCLAALIELMRQDAALGAVASAEVTTQRRNFIKLSRQCLDRVNDLADTGPDSGGGNGGGAGGGNARKNSNENDKSSPVDDINLLLPDVPVDLPNISSLPHAPISAPPKRPTANAWPPTDPAKKPPVNQTFSAAVGTDKRPTSSGRPSSSSFSSVSAGERRQLQVGAMTEAFRRRTGGVPRYLPRVDLKQNQRATLNMAAFRKMEEEREIGRKTREAMEKRMEERKRALEADALARFNEGDSIEDRDKAKFFAAAMVIEQDNAVFPLLKKKLTEAREAGAADDEAKYVDALLAKIVSQRDHPLAELMFRRQRVLMNRLQPLISPYVRKLDSIIVPYYERDENSTPKAVSSSSSAAAEGTADDNSRFIADLEQRQFERQKLLILEEEAIERHLDAVSQDVRMSMELIMSRLTLLYGEAVFGEDCAAAAAARDRAYGFIEKVFFKPLWPLLVNMFRLGNKDDEVQLAKIMTNNMDLDPQDVGVSPSLCLVGGGPDSQHGYEPVIAALHRLATLASPLAKLECLVDMCKVVCGCVDAVKAFNAGGDSPEDGSLGADDLLPILSFAVLKSRTPQLASEARAMSEFIHESYQMGEEGYCLISLQTAIGYIMRLDEN